MSIHVLKAALRDPKLDGVEVITADTYAKIAEALEGKPYIKFVSEWRYDGAGALRYECRGHRETRGEQLSECYKRGEVGGRPKLVGVYSREDLLKLVLAGSGSSVYN